LKKLNVKYVNGVKLVPLSLLSEDEHDIWGFNKKSIEAKILFYEKLITDLKANSIHSIYHRENAPALKHWLYKIIGYRLKKLFKDHCE